ncbi:MAG: hypothetical protein OEO82_02320 [Gammaproteobacteria bacterium]|nr:hypothetical protein [Gammaproteobacteria bacterium]
MDIESISGAATVALASTFVFVLIAKLWQLINLVIGSGRSFSDSIMREAAQRFRDEFERLSRAQSIYLSAGVVFLVLFAAAYLLNAERLFAGYPVWQLYILLAALSVGAVLVAYRLVTTVLVRQQVKLKRDANIAIGHQLQRMASGIGRVYHDVATSSGVIDHLVIGQSGAYAIHVVARHARKNGRVELSDNEIHFTPRGIAEPVVSVAANTASLEREFRRLLDHRVRVRSVIAIPGWNIETQNSDEHLLVNEKNLPMLSGWRDRGDYLMDEDVDALHRLLTSHCKLSVARQSLSSRFRLAAFAPRADLSR